MHLLVRSGWYLAQRKEQKLAWEARGSSEGVINDVMCGDPALAESRLIDAADESIY